MSIQSKGGRAAARALTKEERSARARAAGEARWAKEKGIRKATHESELKIGDIRIPCAVLEDGTRVLSERGTSDAFQHTRSGAEFARKRAADDGDKLPVFLQPVAIKPFISAELLMALSSPIVYQSSKGGKPASGIPAELLAEICEVFLSARRAGVLTAAGERKAKAAEILVSGFARVGIIALVDEATGFQRDRARDALAKILEAYVAKELQKWVRTFPAEYYEQIYRLRGWDYNAQSAKRPPFVGKLTNDIVYSRLAPGVREELEKMTERDHSGRLKTKLFQGLTPEMGHPRLREHLSAIVAVMKLSKSWRQFAESLDIVAPRFGDTYRMDLSTEDDE